MTIGSRCAWPGAKDEPVYKRLDAPCLAIVQQGGRHAT